MPTSDDTHDRPDPPTASRPDAGGTHTHDPARTADGPAAAPPTPDTPHIPGYEVIEEIGHGGMGVVYRARQVTLNRDVAIKTILRADLTHATVARFWAEAEVMAAVKHPHVVQVFELGEHGGRPFMAMEYVAGGSLADFLASGGCQPPESSPLTPRAAAELVEKIARGVAAAHDLGIVHRDLKPANVLLASGGRKPPEVADDSGGLRPPLALEPKVTDFGLAKWRSADLTRTQAFLGTPAYMAPEQAAGRAKFVGPAADVWALGVILYECVAGTRPFTGDTAEALLSQIQSAEPTALRTRVRSVPRDLDTIVAKCLTKEPDGRYPTAAELADDLARFLRGEPITARPVGRAERLVRWVRRKPALAATYGLTLTSLLLAALVAGAVWLWQRAEHDRLDAESARDQLADEKKLTEAARDDAIRLQRVADAGRIEEAKLRGIADKALVGEAAAKKEAERERDKVVRINYGRTIQIAYQAWRDNKLAEARGLLASTRPELRGWEYDYVHRLCHADLVTLEGHTHSVTTAVFSPDGSKVLTASQDGTARIWDASTGKTLAVMSEQPKSLGNLTHSAVFSPDGKKVLTRRVQGSHDKMHVWEAATGKLLVEFKIPHQQLGGLPTTNPSFSPDGSKVLHLSIDRIARVWDVTDPTKPLAEIKGHPLPIASAAFSPDGSKILTTSTVETRIWDATSGKMLKEFQALTASGAWTVSAMFSPDGSKVLTAQSDGSTRIRDANGGNVLKEFKGHTAPLTYAVFSPDGSKVLTTCNDGTGRVWEAASGKQLVELKGIPQQLTAAAFSPDGSKVTVTGSLPVGPLRVWDVASGKILVEYRVPGPWHSSAGFSPDGSKLLTASTDSTARIWDATADKSHDELKETEETEWNAWFGLAVWSPDGSKILTTNSNTPRPLVRFLDATTRKVLAELKGHTGTITSAVYSPDGSKLVTVTQNDYQKEHFVRVWNPATCELITELKGHGPQFRISSAVFSPDGSKVLTASYDASARIFNATTGELLKELKGHRSSVQSAIFSPDGSKVFTVCEYERTVRVWDATTGNKLTELRDPARLFTSAVFSPDGTRLLGIPGILGGYAARVWDAVTGQTLFELTGYTGWSAASWNSTGTRIVTVGGGTVRVWDAESGAELLALPGSEFATFSPDGTRILTHGDTKTALIYDSRPVNRAFVKPDAAPPPRAK